MFEIQLHFSNNLTTLMKRDKLTLNSLSDKAGIPLSTLAEWRTGRQPRDLIKLKKLSLALNVSIDDLLFRSILQSDTSSKDTEAVGRLDRA